MTFLEATQALDALYAQLPTLVCQGLCSHSCGPIGMSALEFVRLKLHTTLPLRGTTFHCPWLKHGRCTVYQYRPMVCRQWGVLETLPCPHGCAPDRILPREEGVALLQQVRALSEHLLPGKAPYITHMLETIREIAARSAAAQVRHHRQ